MQDMVIQVMANFIVFWLILIFTVHRLTTIRAPPALCTCVQIYPLIEWKGVGFILYNYRIGQIFYDDVDIPLLYGLQATFISK
jgi:hypothetical protein